MPANQWQRSCSSADMSMPKSSSALRSIGSPASYPLSKYAARPSKRRSGARVACRGGGAAAAACATSCIPPPRARRPAKIAAENACR